MTWRPFTKHGATGMIVLVLSASACNGRTSGATGGAAGPGAGTASSTTGGSGATVGSGGAPPAATAADAMGAPATVSNCGSLESTTYGPPGTPYTLSTTQITDGCNTCNCVSGNWSCTTNTCQGYPACPSAPPPAVVGQPGSGCGWDTGQSMAGQICSGWGSCSPVCQCNGSFWKCIWPSCFCPATPPAEQVYTESDGQIIYSNNPCDKPGLFCQYGSTCYLCGVSSQGMSWYTPDNCN